eukprot:s134_g33.t1
MKLASTEVLWRYGLLSLLSLVAMQAPFGWLCFSTPGGQPEPWRPWAEQLQGSSDSEQGADFEAKHW